MRVYGTRQGPHETIIDVVDETTGTERRVGVMEHTEFGWKVTHLRQTRGGERRRMRLDPVTGTPDYSDREKALSWVIAQEDNYRG